LVKKINVIFLNIHKLLSKESSFLFLYMAVMTILQLLELGKKIDYVKYIA